MKFCIYYTCLRTFVYSSDGPYLLATFYMLFPVQLIHYMSSNMRVFRNLLLVSSFRSLLLKDIPSRSYISLLVSVHFCTNFSRSVVTNLGQTEAPAMSGQSERKLQGDG